MAQDDQSGDDDALNDAILEIVEPGTGNLESNLSHDNAVVIPKELSTISERNSQS